MNPPKNQTLQPITAGYLQGLIQSGQLTRDQLRPAALVSFRPALEAWKDVSPDPPHEIYHEWDLAQPLVRNLGATADFDLLSVAVVGVTRAALRKAAPRNRALGQSFGVLFRWSKDPCEPLALKARETIRELAPSGEAPKDPGRRILISALGLPGLLNELSKARDSVWTAYVKSHPEAGGGLKRTWLKHLEKQAAETGLAATCTEAARVLSPAGVDLALRNAIVGWSLPRPR